MSRSGDRWTRQNYSQGQCYRGVTLTDAQNVHLYDSRIQDEPNAKLWGNLGIETNTLTCDPVNGDNAAIPGWTASNWIPMGSSINAAPAISIPSDAPSTDGAATLLASKTNPSRPDVDIPAFFAELKDLPSIFKVEGKNLLQKAASLNLNYRFGIKPLIGDLLNTLLFLDTAKARFQELKAHRDTGWKMTKEVWRGSNTSNYVAGYGTDTFGIQHDVTAVLQQRVWGTINWVSDWSSKDDHTTFSDVFRSGLNLGGSVESSLVQSALLSAWELLPWSWFIDYFANVQQLILAKRNTVGYHIGDCHIMRHTTINAQYAVRNITPGFSGGSATFKREVKVRSGGSPNLDAKLPVLSNGQWSILGSLAALRVR